MIHTQLTLTLTLQAPILTHTSGAISFGLDAAMQRDSQGRPVFTGSLIRGNLRHALQTLSEITSYPSQQQIEYWLGKEADTEHQLPHRAKLTFSEYWVNTAWKTTKHTGKRYRIAIDEVTGAVKTGALQVIESPYAVGETPTFTGAIQARLKNKEEVTELQRALNHALDMIPAIGALKTNGFGKILQTKVSIKELKTSKKSTAQSLDNQLLTTSQLGLRIKPSSSFCFAKPAIGENNHFETETHIPAAAIVAAIANRLNEEEGEKTPYTELKEHLSQLHVTHARAVPTDAKKRPVTLPLTLVEAENAFHDISNSTTAETLSGNAPTFLIDWKEEQRNKANQQLNPQQNTSGNTNPDINLKIRTAINPNTGTANDNQLFSMETVSPEGFDWLSNLSLNKIPEAKRNIIVKQLHTLFQHPLIQLGKTKASATVQLENKYPYCTPEKTISDTQVIIYLQTPARLLPTGYQSAGTNQGDNLYEAYQEAWGQFSNNSLKLSHFFAQQKLEGGEHWWRRFRSNSSNSNDDNTDNYHPEIFTQSGSVFILDILEPDKAKTHLTAWQQQGLPQLENTPGGEHWETNPWIASNGYGEIAINLNIREVIKND